MAEHSAVRAPYNFVPFSDKVLIRYQQEKELPPHDVIDPKLKSGEIHITMTADTPVFVSNGKNHEPEFFRAPNGKYALPGSTIRGMVRENMQILGFGLIRPDKDLRDHQIFYRVVASGNKTVTKTLQQYYCKTVMDVTTKTSINGKPYSIPQKVSIGYLRKSLRGDYEILPACGSYLRVSKNHPDVQRHGDIKTGTYDVAYCAKGKQVTTLRFTSVPIKGMSSGTLLCTGRPIKQNCLYLFPAPDRSKQPIPISKEDEISYMEDFENRKNVLSPKSFWELPKGRKEKPVFFTRYEGHIYFGMSLFLRIGHKYALSDGLPKHHRELAKRAVVLDYPYAILGFAEKKSAYRARVSFGDLEAVGSVKADHVYKTVLGQPKPSYFPGYVVNGKSYSDDGFQLRGYKQYWLKEVGPLPEGKSNVTSALRPLPKGTKFHGVIRYKNLQEDELGLLLWCLRLDSGCFQSVGMGKPYGFGRMKLNIDALLEYDFDSLYDPKDLCGRFTKNRTDAVDSYIDAYDAYASGQLDSEELTARPSIQSFPEIEDFIYMRKTLRRGADVNYMSLGEYQNIRSPLPDVKEISAEEQGIGSKK